MFLNNEKNKGILVSAWQSCPPENPRRLRCHEMARFLKDGFQAEGVEAWVCDGFATYQTNYLAEMIKFFSPIAGCLSFRAGFRQEKTDQEIIDSIIHIVKAHGVVSFNHSWRELMFDGLPWRVDFHPNMFIPDSNGNELGKLRWWSAHKIELTPTAEMKYYYLSCGQETIENGRQFINVQHPDIASWRYRIELRTIPEFL